MKETIAISFSWPKPTGTSNGSCNSKDSTIVTTSVSTTGWNMEDVEPVRQHLLADPEYQRRLVRFLENHDEPRAAATFSPDKHRAAAVVALTLQGAKLLHEGQFQGRRTRVTVFLGRRPEEPSDLDLERFYHALLRQTAEEPFQSGEWTMCECDGWADNMSCRNLLAWCWKKATARSPGDRQLFWGLFSGACSAPMVRCRHRNMEFGRRALTATVRAKRRGDDRFRVLCLD